MLVQDAGSSTGILFICHQRAGAGAGAAAGVPDPGPNTFPITTLIDSVLLRERLRLRESFQ